MRISGKQLLKSMGWAISFIPRNPLFFHTEADFLLNNLVFIAIFCYTLLSDEEGDNFIRAVIWNTSRDKNKQEQSIPMLESVFKSCLVKYSKTK